MCNRPGPSGDFFKQASFGIVWILYSLINLTCIGQRYLPSPPIVSTATVHPGTTTTRPLLSPKDEANFTVLAYLEKAGDVLFPVVDHWDPRSGIGELKAIIPSFQVAKSGGTHTSVQAAIDAAVAVGGRQRIYIKLASGTYREVVCVPTKAPPITLYSTESDFRSASIVFDNYSGKPKLKGSPANPCEPNLQQETFSTFGSATFAVYADDFSAGNITFINDTDEALAQGAIQAVALMTRGDRLIFDTVGVLGNQDTLFVKTPNVATISRVYFKNSYIEGDVDFIFGRGTLVLDHCTLHSLTRRTSQGVVLAPSTDSRNPYGFLVTHSTFTAEPGTQEGSVHLGRAWDERQVNLVTYKNHVLSGVYPNGQAVVRDSVLGLHLHPTAPWQAAATTHRPYSSVGGAYPANRFAEVDNRTINASSKPF